MIDDYTVRRGFGEATRPQIAAIYWTAFRDKFSRILAPDRAALAYLAASLRPSHGLVAEGGDGRTIGVAGFKTAEGAFIGRDYARLVEAYGRVGALWRGLVLGVLERPIERDTLLMDGIAVAEAARGRGVGTRLVAEVCREARRRGLGTVRLDVIEANRRARALYERLGFRATGTVELGPLRHLVGFSRSTTMRLDVHEAVALDEGMR